MLTVSSDMFYTFFRRTTPDRYSLRPKYTECVHLLKQTMHRCKTCYGYISVKSTHDCITL